MTFFINSYQPVTIAVKGKPSLVEVITSARDV